jgi:hypothetical protein
VPKRFENPVAVPTEFPRIGECRKLSFWHVVFSETYIQPDASLSNRTGPERCSERCYK